MLDTMGLRPPDALEAILRDTEAAGFEMASEARTGALLRVLAASKPAGRILELGTGTGVATAWMLQGMDVESRLLSVDSEPTLLEIARRHLENDQRVSLRLMDGADAIRDAAERGDKFDMIFADTGPGKFTHLTETIDLLRPGGLYVVDDLLMQPTWPSDHAAKVFAFLAAIEAQADVVVTRLNWSTGLLIAAKI